MRTLLRASAFATLCLICTIGSALSADLPKKVLSSPILAPDTCTQTSCSGPYLTGGFGGLGTNIAFLQNGIGGSLAAGGGIFDVGAGYQLWNGQYFAAVEASVGYQTSGANGGALSSGNAVGLEQIKLGAALQGLLGGATPAPAQGGQAPTALPLPSSLTQSFMAPYFAIGSMQRPHANVMVSGVGAEFLLSSGFTLDAEYLYAPPMSSDGASNIGRISLQYHFKP